MKVKIKVFGAGSLEVDGAGEVKDIYEWIKNSFIGTTFFVKEVKRGAPRKVKKDVLISEGAAGASEQG